MCGVRGLRGLSAVVLTLVTVVHGALLVPSASPAPRSFPALPRPAHVLVLHTFGGDWPMRVAFYQALERAFRADGVAAPVELFHETAEIYRLPDAVDTWRDYLRAKYAETRIDAIVAVWDPALTLLRQHRRDLFPGVPVVYIRWGAPDPADQPAGMTGIWLGAKFLENVGLIRNVRPQLRTLYVIDAIPSNTGNIEREVVAQSSQLPWLKLRYLRDRPLDEVRSTLGSASNDSAAFFFRQGLPEPGEQFGQLSGLAAVLDASAVPIFGGVDSHIGLGVVGGHMWSTEDNTVLVASMVRKIVSGTAASSIDPIPAATKSMFDARALERWGISQRRLPEGAIVLNHPPSLWRDHQKAVIATAAAFLALTLLAAGLIVQNDRRRRAEGGRQRSEAQTAAILRVVPDLMFVIRADGVYLDYRARSVDELFLPPSQFLGKRLRDIFPPELAEPFEKGIAKAMASGEPVTIEYSLTMAEEDRHYEARIVRRDDDAALTIVRDVTDRYRAEERLHKAEADLAQASRLGSLGELAAGIAHELNQPLAAMITNARATLRRMDARAETDGYVRESLQDIVADGRRASEILSRIIGTIKPESVKSATLSLNELATDVATLTRRTLFQKRVALRLDLDAALPSVKGDRVQLQQVLMNFVLNAVDAMAASNGRPRVVTIRTALEGGRVRLSVADTGPGLPGADAEQLFTRFFTTKPDHMGIGLSLCRRIAEAHGGEVRLARNSPEGATFELEVPAA